jgi:hypothetical protein
MNVPPLGDAATCKMMRLIAAKSSQKAHGLHWLESLMLRDCVVTITKTAC